MIFSKLVLKYRILLIAVILVLASLSVLGIFRLNISVSIADYFMEGDDAVENQKHFEKIFGRNDFFGVLFESENVFSPQSLEKINEIGNKIQQEIPFAANMRSIAKIDPRELGGSVFRFDTLGVLVSDTVQQEKITKQFLDDPSLVGTLFSRNCKEAWIMVSLSIPKTGQKLDEFELGEIIYNTISEVECSSSMTITAVGISVYAFRKKSEMLNDLSTIMLIGAISALLLCIIILRRITAILAALSLILLTPLLVFGTLGWLNISADSAFISVPMLLTMGVSIGTAVHINHFFNHHFTLTGKRKESVLYAIEHTWRPVLYTVITTIAALLSFAFVQIKPIIWVGFVSAACILILYFLSMILFPIIISFGKNSEPSGPSKDSMPPYFSFFTMLSAYVLRNQKPIVIIFGVISLFSILGILMVKIDFSAEEMMGTKLDHMRDRVKVRHSEICSNDFMDISITGDTGWFRKSENIDRLCKLQESIDSLTQIKRTSSIIQLISKANRRFHRLDNNFYTSGMEQFELDDLYNKVENLSPGYIKRWVTEDFSTARIFIELTDFSSKVINQNIDEIDKLVNQVFPTEKGYFLSGYTYQMALMNQRITSGLVRSIGFALALITILMMVSFQSVKLGIVAMLPNIFPVAVCGAVIGYTGIPLEFVTMTVAPLILGLSVDDTIHFITSLKRNITKFNNYEKGIEASYNEVGIAISKTTIILFFAFLVFTASRIQSTVNMGILSCAGITAAYFADIFLVPILIKKINAFKIDKSQPG